MSKTSKSPTTTDALSPAKMRRAPSHPGEIFRLDYRQAGTDAEISQVECARRMGMPLNRLNEIEKGKRGVSAETAWLFSALTGTSPDLWLNLQTRYDLWHALQKIKGRLKKIAPMRAA